ncbi:MAG: glycosyltransferase family 2 protein [Campylobacterales bacterium]
MISVTILTFNSQKYLQRVLESTASFDEVLLLDSGSEDKTLEIAKSFANVVVYQAPLDEGFGVQHQRTESLAKNEWILSLDSDEVLSGRLVEEIESLSLDRRCIYSIKRDNYYRGKKIECCSWYPDRVYRLYNKNTTGFDSKKVHESVKIDGLSIIYLKHPMTHYSYENASDFLAKMQKYSELFANENLGKKSSSPFKAISRGCFTFFKSYILKKGFLQGYEGFVISVYNAQSAFWKYIKLYEKSGI